MTKVWIAGNKCDADYTVFLSIINLMKEMQN